MSASGVRDRTQLVLQLVEHTLNRAGVKGDSSHQVALQLFSYVVRLLGSNLSPTTILDENALIKTLQDGLAQQDKADAAAKLLDCNTRLNGILDSRTRAGLLLLFSRLAKDYGSAPGFSLPTAAGSLATQQLGMQAGLPRIHPSLDQPSAPNLSEGSVSITDPSAIPVDNDVPAGLPIRALRPGSTTSDHTSNTFTVKEPLLVRDVLFACQGISGKFTVYQDGDVAHGFDKQPERDQGSGFSVIPEAQVPAVERMLVCRLTELGWLFKRVQQHVNGSTTHKPGTGSHHAVGAYRQALHGAMQAELADFYRLMAVLEAHATQPIPLPGEGEGGGTYLTLRRLVVWLNEPLRRMRLLALLADTTSNKRGGALAGAVHALTYHGDPTVAGFSNKVLHAVCMPLFGMIRRWVFEGVLEDPHSEFFIQAAPWVSSVAAATKSRLLAGELAHLSRAGSQGGAAGRRDLWRHGYWVAADQLPAFISTALASKVLRAGKSINFLQAVCGDTHWAQEVGAAAAAGSVSSSSSNGLLSNPGELDALERAVDAATGLVDARVMEVLTGRHQLFKHCEALRRYLLLGQGDFVQALMELVSQELNQESHNVSEMNLNHALRTAIASSCAKYDDEDVLDRLRARKDRTATGKEPGWDIFTLQYDVPGPLATVFTPEAMSQYLRVFQLLWKLKRAESSLASTWTLLQCEINRALSILDVPGVVEARKLARRFLRVRADMSHFTTNLQYYLMFEVLEAAWQEFSRRSTAAADLDTLITAHEAYLNTLMRKAFLDEGSEVLRRTLTVMTDNMWALYGVVNRFSIPVKGATNREKDRARQVAQRTAKGQWGVVAGDVKIDIPKAELDDIAVVLANIEKQHATALQAFTHQLPAEAHDEVRFLLYRLDFNDFNSRTFRTTEDDTQM